MPDFLRIAVLIACLFIGVGKCLSHSEHSAGKASDSLFLAPGFVNDMVLQRRKPIVVQGSTGAGALVTVEFLGQKLKTMASANGAWKVVFPAAKHGGPYTMRVESSAQKIILQNILVGDVWLCSGQSNMDFKLMASETGPEDLRKGVANPNIRLFKLNNLAETGNIAWDSTTLASVNRGEFFDGRWEMCDNENAKSFSAVGYYFGRAIAQSENVPIGLIQVAVGGSPTESWIGQGTIDHDTLLSRIAKTWGTSAEVMLWCRERAALNIRNAKTAGQRHPYQPGYNFEAGITAVTSMPITGVIWYQGESNVHNVSLHEHLFQSLVNGWRGKWGYVFPFYYVQLSGIDRPQWPEFRDSQRKMLAVIPQSGMVVSYDLGDSLNVHPLRKKEIGERLARLALKYTYRRKMTAEGPVAENAVRDGQTILINFSSATRLYAKGGGALRGFEIVTDSGISVPSYAAIENNRVRIGIPDGQKISTVLYAYQPFTRANLVNQAGLPASTFSIKVK